MNKNQKTILSMLVLALMAFSIAAALTPAIALTEPSTPAGLQWPNALVNPGQLTVAGSSTVAPVATEEITPPAGTTGFTAYFNNLIATSGGKVNSPTLTTDVSLSGFGSGTAVPALDYTGGVADVGEMSRPLSSTEYSVPCMANLQQWAIGVDSVAIVMSKDMSWFLPALAAQTPSVTGLTTLQVAELFQDTSPTTTAVNQGLTTGASGYVPYCSTWASFFALQGWTVPSADATLAAATINRAARDPTSGTFDCFNNYFAVPNGYQFENKAVTSTSNGQSTVVGSQEMAAFTYCEENANIQSTITASSANNYIAFISLGYLTNAGTSMIGIPIAYTTNTTPTTSGSPLIHYYGTAISATSTPPEVGFATGTVNPPVWSAPVQPTQANVIWAYSGQKVTASSQWGAATGMYQAWRWLWEVTPGAIPSSGPCLAAGVWIAYMMEPGTTHSGTSNFVQDASYIPLSRADMAGGTPIDSNLNTYSPVSTQTQTIPDGKVSGTDFFYFVDAYIAYYANNIYNPYADTTAQGYINGASFFGFVGAYVNYFTTYAPT
ncbi:MAG: hypothetical protein ABSF65_04865 [Candidatus Bathyarchaeia archaeon]